jgi:hypothetical protein
MNAPVTNMATEHAPANTAQSRACQTPLSREAPGDDSRRVTWPEVAVLAVALSFGIFLTWRDLSVRDATITTISTPPTCSRAAGWTGQVPHRTNVPHM